MMLTMYLISVDRPYRLIVVTECEVKLCKKSAWAVHPSGRRFKVGVSAFQTVEEATRHRTKRLTDMVNNNAIRICSPLAWAKAREALNKVKSSST